MSNTNNNDWSPNYGGKSQYAKKKHFGFDKETQSLTFRVLPQPKGHKYNSLEYNNTPFSSEWHRFIVSIFGYKTMDGKYRVFESPLVKDNKTKTIKSPCAATDLITELKAKLEEARATGNAAIQPKLNTLVGQKGVYSINKNQHMNAILLDGQMGEMKLGYKAFLAFKAEIDRIREGGPDELGFDPLSFNNGRFFTITRSNMGRDTTFNVSVYKEKVDVPGLGKVEKPFVHAITPEILARLETEGFNLDKVHLKVTSEECAQIVAEADLMSGKSPAVNRIFDDKWKNNREANKNKAEASTTQTSPESLTAVTTPDVALSTVTAPTVTLTTVTGPALPVGSVQSTASTGTVTQVKAPAANVDEMSDADFFKSIGVEVGA